MYHSWIHPLHHSFIPLFHSWNSFNRFHFSFFSYRSTWYFHHIHPVLMSSPQWLSTLQTGPVKNPNFIWDNFVIAL
jgi:hypothetical protein